MQGNHQTWLKAPSLVLTCPYSHLSTNRGCKCNFPLTFLCLSNLIVAESARKLFIFVEEKNLRKIPRSGGNATGNLSMGWPISNEPGSRRRLNYRLGGRSSRHSLGQLSSHLVFEGAILQRSTRVRSTGDGGRFLRGFAVLANLY